MKHTDDSDRTSRRASPIARILRKKQEFVKRFGTNEERLAAVKDLMKRPSQGGESRAYPSRSMMKGSVR